MEKINKLRDIIKEKNLDGYVIPKNDEFFGEYVQPASDGLKYISNFSGSFGFAIILQKKNYLFVDGRYTLQASKQSGKNFTIVTFPNKFPKDVIKKNLKIGFNPKLHTSQSLGFFFKNTKCKLFPLEIPLIKSKNHKINSSTKNRYWFIKKNDVGESYLSKIKKIQNKLIRDKIDLILITAPENLCWVLNLRGMDGKYSPLVNGYLIISKSNKKYLFLKKDYNGKIKSKLNGIKVLGREKMSSFLKNLTNKKIRIDSLSCSVYFKQILNHNNVIIEKPDYTYLLKSQKNSTEIRNIKKSHIIDGVALTKFLIWLRDNYNKKKITEIDAQNKLLRIRKLNKNFFGLSFPTISASGPNGAIIHYKAEISSNRVLKKGDIYLIDSGAQYKFGTTDVTRTISLQNKNLKIKEIFTRVLKGHIGVDTFLIKKKTTGKIIDKMARKYLQKINLDYPHGTGHGVGYFSNVHEGPQTISKNHKGNFLNGMILSNEPGYYQKNKFGIRIENLVAVRKAKKGSYFETLTLAPIDKSLILKKLLNTKELYWINNYHRKVYKKLKPFMNKREKIRLKEICSKI